MQCYLFPPLRHSDPRSQTTWRIRRSSQNSSNLLRTPNLNWREPRANSERSPISETLSCPATGSCPAMFPCLKRNLPDLKIPAQFGWPGSLFYGWDQSEAPLSIPGSLSHTVSPEKKLCLFHTIHQRRSVSLRR